MDDFLFLEVISYMGLSFPLELPLILNDENQLYLKVIAWLNQEGQCICGREGVELHHALVTRKDVMGFNGPVSFIQDSRNVLLLCLRCHRNISRERSYRILCDIFGAKVIGDWYDSIEFKSTFRKLPSQI